jgi:hypothetical protein
MTVVTPLAIQARDERIRHLEESLAAHKVMLSDALDREAALKATLTRIAARKPNAQEAATAFYRCREDARAVLREARL